MSNRTSSRNGFFARCRTRVAHQFAAARQKDSPLVEMLESRIAPASGVTITATLVASLANDVDGDGVADPGDTIHYKEVISNSSQTDALNVQVAHFLDSNTNLVPGSLNISPLAGDDTYSAVGNTTLEVGVASGVSTPAVKLLGNLFTNDREFANDLGAMDTFTLKTYDATSTQGGTVHVNADGTFSYLPKAGFTGTDTFTYTITDKGVDGIAGNADDLTGSGTVTINVSGLVWYVDSASASGTADGTSEHPFKTLTALSGATRQTGDTMYIKKNASNYSGNISLLANEQLIGSGVDLILGGKTLATATTNTTLANSGGTIISLNSGNTVRGFDLADSNVDMAGGAVGSLTVDHVSATLTGSALQITTSGALSVTFDKLEVTGSSTTGITLTGTSGTVTANNVSMSGITNEHVLVSGGTVNATFNGSLTKTSAGALVSVTNGHTGTLTFANGTLDATGGTGLQFNNADGTYNFNGTTTLHGGDAGIDITNGSSGTFAFNSNTSIANPTGIAFNLQDSNAAVTYSGSISHNAKTLISINNHDSGTILFQTGSLTSTATGAGAGAGITIQQSNGGTITFNNPSISLHTGANNAIDLSADAGGTVSFGATTLDLLTTSGGGLIANAGGTLNVTGSNNTIASGTGTALSLTNSTTIGASSLTFKSISANGAANGIVLNGTGSNGLTVTGDGSSAKNGTGGTIQSTTGIGISLTNANNVTLRSMNLTSIGNDAISSSGGSNINLAGVQIQNPTGHGWNASNLTGTNSVDNNLITGFNGSQKNGIRLNNVSTNFTSFTLSNSTVSSSATGGDGFLVVTTGATSGTVNVTSNTFTGIDQDAVQISNDGSGTLTAVVKKNNFTTADTTGGDGNNTLFLSQGGSGTLNFTIGGPISSDGNTFSDLGRLEALAGVIQVNAAGSGTNGAKLNGTIQNNTITNSYGRRGIMVLAEASSGAQGGHTVQILDNTINNVGHEGIYVGLSSVNGAANLNNAITINNNQVGTTSIVGARGAYEGLKVEAFHDGSGAGGNISANVLIQGNSVRTNNSSPAAETVEIVNDAFVLSSGTATTTLNVTVLGNTFTNDNASGRSFAINSFDPGSTTSLDLDASGATSNSSNRGFLINQWAGTFFIEGMSTGSHAASEVNTFLGGKNTGGVTATGTFQGTASTPMPLLLAPELQVPTTGTITEIVPATETPAAGTDLPATSPTDSPATTPAQPEPIVPAVPVDDGFLTQDELNALVEAAIVRWTNAGLTGDQVALLHTVSFHVSDLSGWNLGQAEGHVITLDVNAAGLGWLVDATPLDDSEFGTVVSSTHLSAGSGLASSRVDALTTVMHELGHVLGLNDSYVSSNRHDLMFGYIALGERRLPGMNEAAGVTPHASADGPDFAFSPYLIGTLPAGKSVTVVFDATIANPMTPNSANSVTAHGEITGSNFALVTTDDPSTVATNDATTLAVPKSDLSLSKTVDHANPKVGDTVQFTITLNNTGPDAAQGVQVKDLLPAGLTFVSASTLAGSYNSGTGIWNVGSVASSGSVTLTINATVDSGGTKTNVAEVFASTTPDVDSTPNDQTGDDYATTSVTPVALIGDLVYNDTNFNGIQDAGETGVSGVTVKLFSSGDTLIGTTTTDGTGHYQFQAAPGDYYVQFALPNGYAFAAKDQGGNDAVDSDADTTTGKTAVFTAVSGVTDNSIDAGMAQVANVGDFVWHDLNGNGVQDAGETGLSGVTVKLLDNSDNVLSTTTTDANGLYHFQNLLPGTYKVQFVAPNGYQFSSGTDTTAAFTLVGGQTDNGRDAGLYQPVTIGDHVFEDLNGNGVQDAGENGLSGVTVKLLDNSNNVLATTTTDASGNYSFTGKAPGTYKVQVIAPSGYHFTFQDRGADDTLDSDVSSSTGVTSAFSLTSGTNHTSVDAGLYQGGSIGDFVWKDANGNGVQDSGETGMDGVQVTLRWAGPDGDMSTTADNTTTTVTTAGGGLYSFTDLAPGTYRVEVARPANYAFTTQDAGVNDALDSDVPTGIAATGITAHFSLTSGQVDSNHDAGLYELMSVGNRVWHDTNNDGVHNAGESGLSGLTVNLYLDADGNGVISGAETAAIATQVTDANGAYLFTGLTQGKYMVEVVAPGYFSSTGAASLVSGTYEPAAASNPDMTDHGNAASPGKVQSAIFSLTPGTAPTGETDTTLPVGVSDTASDANSNRTIDFGLFQPATIGDFVFKDMNNNGIQDAGETGVSGVTVKLYSSTDALVGTTTTDANGHYQFSVAPADYYVQFVLPSGHAFGAKGQGGDDSVDSDANTATGKTAIFTVASGITNNSLDAALVPLASVGDFVWHDLNADGVQDAGEAGLAGVTVKLLDGSNNVLTTTTTDANGLYHFQDLLPGTYKVQFVAPNGYQFSTGSGTTAAFSLVPGQNDTSRDAGLFQPLTIGDHIFHDLNGNGIQDNGEAGISGVTVQLLDGSSNLLATTTTDANGNYSFTGQAPGTYKIKVIALTGYQFTFQDRGADDSLDSDVSSSTGVSAAFTLASGATNSSVDAGLYHLGTIGNFVWNDANGNGVQDPGETGIDGVQVTLRWAGPDGDMSTTGDNTTTTVTTSGGGLYSFTNLAPGNYRIEVARPANYAFTTQDVGVNDQVDSDVAGGKIDTAFSANFGITSGQSELTKDVGLYELMSVGNRVWLDANNDGVHNPGESGLGGLTVNLYRDADGNGLIEGGETVPVATQLTDANGAYLFTGLTQGKYQVEVVAPGYHSSTGSSSFSSGSYEPASVTNADMTDHGNAAAPGTIHSGVFSLIPGASPTGETDTTLPSGVSDPASDANSNRTIDFGLFKPATIGNRVFLDTNANGIQDNGELGISGVIVKLYDSADNLVATTTTDGTGLYSFSNLAPASYSVGFVQPDSSYHFSAQDQGSDDAVDSDADVSTGRTASFAIVSNQTTSDVDAGLYQNGTISGHFFEDLNANGIQDAGEPNLVGKTVNLIGTTNASTTTDANGNYTFSDVMPGSYKVEFVNSAGYFFSPQDQGSDDTKDSDVSIATGQTGSFTVSSGNAITSIDAGAFQKASIGDFVFVDHNANGIQDAGELGLDGLTVNLLDSGGSVVSTTTTANGGAYNFTGLIPGSYSVEVIAPTGHFFSPEHVGSDGAVDSDVDTGTGKSALQTLTSGQAVTDIDAGLFEKTRISGKLFMDNNADGLMDAGDYAVVNYFVSLYDSHGSLLAIKIAATSVYSFNDLIPGDYTVGVSSFFNNAHFSPQDQGSDDTIDSDVDATGKTAPIFLGSGDLTTTADAGIYLEATVTSTLFLDNNANGIHDNGEATISGATVRLLDSNGNTLSESTTDGNGQYSFTGLTPGSYGVQWVAPAGMGFTFANVGADDTIDSDANQVTGKTALFTLTSGQTDASIGAGVFATATIQGDVFRDLNANNVHDKIDPGLSGNTVHLLDSNSSLAATTVTDANGHYTFEGLIPGAYSVEVIAKAGYKFVAQDQGSDDTLDSDVNVSTGRTAPLTLVSGDVVSHLDAGMKTTGIYAVSGGTGSQPLVKVFDATTGDEKFEFLAYDSSFKRGVTLATGDVNGDGVMDIITAADLGGKATVRVFDGVNGQMVSSFVAYNGVEQHRVFVAAGDVNHDGLADIITGAGVGGRGVVKVFSGQDNSLLSQFTAYTGNYRTVLTVGAGDVNGDGFADIVTGTGTGNAGPVKVFSGQDGHVLGKINPFGANYSRGVYVSMADVNGDGLADILAGTGPGGPAKVKIYNGTDFTQIQSIDVGPNGSPGVRVAGVDINADGLAEIICAAGRPKGTDLSIFRGDGTLLSTIPGADPVLGGIFVAAGDPVNINKITTIQAA